jgi:hypothetical protein
MVPRGQDDQKFDFVIILEQVISSKHLNNGEGECHSLSGAGSIPGDKILAFVNMLEGLILDGEEFLDSFFQESVDDLLVLDEI